MSPKIDIIIFDLGGVLVDWNPMNVYLKVFNGDVKKAQWFIDNVCTYDWNIEQDGGRTIAEAVALKSAEFPEYKDLIELYYDQWEYMFAGIIEDNVKLFRQLKQNQQYKIYALTNWSAEKWDKGKVLFPFFNEFDGVVVSGQEKTRKPFKKIYDIILDRYQITPEKAIFIDDNLENVKAARELNISAIHYQNQKQLIQELSQLIAI